jgi:hypothetical protein
MANVSSFSGAMPVIPGGLVELGYSQITADVAVVSTNSASPTSIIPALSVVCDGGPVLVEFWGHVTIGTSTDSNVITILSVDGTPTSRLSVSSFGPTLSNPSGTQPVRGAIRLTPTAGSHTFAVGATYGAATGSIRAGAGNTSTSFPPAFLRVSKIVNQNDGLKPFWTPPVVTQLPSQATEGDQVLLYSSSPYAGYQTHQYVSGSWRTLDDSRGVGAWQAWTPAVYQNGARTVSNIVSRYIQVGKTVHVNALLQVTNAGTTSQAITWSLPVAAINPSNGYVAGVFNYSRASGTRYMGSWAVNNGFGGQTTAQVSGTVDQLGIDPAFATANGDYLSFSGTYEAA